MRFGLIGTSYWAREVHATALAAAPHAELAGVWGRDAAKAADLAATFGVGTYASPDELFADVDAVSFSVPPDVQARLAVDAARAGCHLLLEKPTGLTPQQATAVLEAVEEVGVASVVFFTSRFVPEVDAWLQRARRTEGWSGAQVHWLGSIFHPGNPFGESPWRREQGALWDVGPHALSVVLPILGPVAHVTGQRGDGDTVHAILRHVGGASTTLTLSLTAPQEAAGTSVALYGTTGWERMPASSLSPADAHRRASQELVGSAASGDAHPCDARFGREVVDTLARIADALD